MTGIPFETAAERDARLAAKPRRIDCSDAPVSTTETAAEVQARQNGRKDCPVGEPRWDAREIARSALGELPEGKRGPLLAELLIELRGPTALQLLCAARNDLTRRIDELIDEQYPLHELTGVIGAPAAIHARMIGAR